MAHHNFLILRKIKENTENFTFFIKIYYFDFEIGFANQTWINRKVVNWT